MPVPPSREEFNDLKDQFHDFKDHTLEKFNDIETDWKDFIEDLTTNQIGDMKGKISEVKNDVTSVSTKFETLKLTNQEEHKRIMEGQDKVHERLDTFLTAQGERERKIEDRICNAVEKKLNKSLDRQDNHEKVLYGTDKDGGLISKSESNKTSIIAIWTIIGIIFVVLLAIIGYVAL